MSSYYFATFHQKKTTPATCSKDIKTPKKIREAASQSRQTAVDALEKLYNNPTSLGDEHLMAEARQLTDIYLGWIVRLQHDGFNADLYCYWGESIAPRLNHAFNDLNYDAANILFNRAVILMNHSNHILTFNVTHHNLESNEKQAYTSLCLAAGDFKLAQDLVATVSMESSDGTKSNSLLADITPEFLEMMGQLCLAQAQEIGASKACRKDDGHVADERKKKHNLVAKLVHQCFILYQDATKLATRKVVCPTEKFTKLIKFLEVKSAVYEGLTCAYSASQLYDTQPEEALWFMHRSNELTSPVRSVVEKAKFDHYVCGFLDGAEQTQRHIQDRIESMNRLVVRAKPCEKPVAYPAAQVLARVKEVVMPEPASVASDGGAAVGDKADSEWDVIPNNNNKTIQDEGGEEGKEGKV